MGCRSYKASPIFSHWVVCGFTGSAHFGEKAVLSRLCEGRPGLDWPPAGSILTCPLLRRRGPAAMRLYNATTRKANESRL